MTNRDPGSVLPPEIRAELVPEEVESITDLWLKAARHDKPEDAWVLEQGDQMRAFLRQKGALPPAVIHPGGRAQRILRRLHIVPVQRWQGFAAIAACVLILIAVGITVNQSTLEAAYGEQFTHILPDGTTLLLNSGTKIRIASDYNERTREVRLLRGEVFFEVVNSDKPFVVETVHGTVAVLGTAFDVRYWPSDAESATQVAVRTGKVRVTSKSGREVILTAGSAARLELTDRTPVALSGTSADNQISWTNHSFKYSDHFTTDILEELERRYDIDIQVEVEGLEDTRSGILLENPAGPEQILNDICALHMCAYSVSPDGRTFWITQR